MARPDCRMPLEARTRIISATVAEMQTNRFHSATEADLFDLVHHWQLEKWGQTFTPAQLESCCTMALLLLLTMCELEGENAKCLARAITEHYHGPLTNEGDLPS